MKLESSKNLPVQDFVTKQSQPNVSSTAKGEKSKLVESWPCFLSLSSIVK